MVPGNLQQEHDRIITPTLFNVSLKELLDQEHRSMMQYNETKRSLEMLQIRLPDGIDAQWLMYLPFAFCFEVVRYVMMPHQIFYVSAFCII